MNSSYLRYCLKKDYKTIGIILGLSAILGITVDSIFKTSLGFTTSFLNVGIDIVTILLSIIIWIQIIDRDNKDVINSLPIKKGVFLNTLLVRTFLTIAVPYFFVSLFTYYTYNTKLDYNIEMVEFALELSTALLKLTTFVLLMVICGRVSSVLINGGAMYVIIIFAGMVINDLLVGSGFNVHIGNYAKIGLSIFITVLVLIAIKYYYKRREVENLGRAFMFDNHVMIASVFYSLSLGALYNATAHDSGDMSIVKFMIIIFVVAIIYTGMLGTFTKGEKSFSKYFKYILIPLVVNGILSICIWSVV